MLLLKEDLTNYGFDLPRFSPLHLSFYLQCTELIALTAPVQDIDYAINTFNLCSYVCIK